MEAANECVRQVAIEIPWKDVASTRTSLMKGVRKKAAAPGFRRGRIPSAVLHRLYRAEILQALKDDLCMRFLVAGAVEKNWKLAGPPTVDEMHFEEGSPLQVKGTVEVFPDFELGDYSKLKVVVPAYRVTNKLLARQLRQLRVQHASYRNVDPRPVRDGDAAVLALVGTAEGPEPVVDLDEVTVMIGDETNFREFNELLPGMVPGERREFDVDYPEDVAREDLAGKTVHYRAKLLDIRERELPALDDEFAKDVSNQLETLDDLKHQLRLQLQGEFQKHSRQQARNNLLRRLAELHPMPLPPAYLEARLRDLASEGQDPAATDFAPTAEQRTNMELTVRAELVLDQIAQAERLKVPPEVVEAEIRRFAESERKTPAEARKELGDKGMISRFRTMHLREMALGVVFEKADTTTMLMADGQGNAVRIPTAAARG